MKVASSQPDILSVGPPHHLRGLAVRGPPRERETRGSNLTFPGRVIIIIIIIIIVIIMMMMMMKVMMVMMIIMIIIIIIMVVAFKGAFRDFFTISSLRREPSPTCTLKWPGRKSCANHTQHTERLSCAICRITCHVVRRDSSAIKFDRV